MTHTDLAAAVDTASDNIRQALTAGSNDAAALTSILLILQALRETVATTVEDSTDLAFGRGYREGHERGVLAGWDARDASARVELVTREGVIADLRLQLAGADRCATAEAESDDAPADTPPVHH